MPNFISLNWSFSSSKKYLKSNDYKELKALCSKKLSGKSYNLFDFYPNLKSILKANKNDLNVSVFEKITKTPFQFTKKTNSILNSKDSFNILADAYLKKLDLLTSIYNRIQANQGNKTTFNQLQDSYKLNSLNNFLDTEFKELCVCFSNELEQISQQKVNKNIQALPSDLLFKKLQNFINKIKEFKTLFLGDRIKMSQLNIPLNELNTILDKLSIFSSKLNSSDFENKTIHILRNLITVDILQEKKIESKFSVIQPINSISIEKKDLVADLVIHINSQSNLSAILKYSLLFLDNQQFDTLKKSLDLSQSTLKENINYIEFLRNHFDFNSDLISSDLGYFFFQDNIQSFFRSSFLNSDDFIGEIILNFTLKADSSHSKQNTHNSFLSKLKGSLDKKELISYLESNSSLSPSFLNLITDKTLTYIKEQLANKMIKESATEMGMPNSESLSNSNFQALYFTDRYKPIQGENIKADFKEPVADIDQLKTLLGNIPDLFPNALAVLSQDLIESKWLIVPNSENQPSYYVPKINQFKSENGQNRCEFDWSINLSVVHPKTLQSFLEITNKEVNQVIDALKKNNLIDHKNEWVGSIEKLTSTFQEINLDETKKSKLISFFELKNHLKTCSSKIQKEIQTKIMRNTYIVNIRFSQSMFARFIPFSTGAAHTEMLFRYKDENGKTQNLCCGMVGYGKNEKYHALFKKSDGSFFRDGIRISDPKTATNCIESAFRRRDSASKKLNWFKGIIWENKSQSKLKFFYNNWHPTLRLSDFFQRTCKRGLMDFVLRQHDFPEKITMIGNLDFVSDSIDEKLSRKISSLLKESFVLTQTGYPRSQFNPESIKSFARLTDVEFESLQKFNIIDTNGFINSSFKLDDFSNLKDSLIDLITTDRVQEILDALYVQLPMHKLRARLYDLGLAENDINRISEKLTQQCNNLKKSYGLKFSNKKLENTLKDDRFKTFLYYSRGKLLKKYVPSATGNLVKNNNTYSQIQFRSSNHEDSDIQLSNFTNMQRASVIKKPVKDVSPLSQSDYQSIFSELQELGIIDSENIIQIDTEDEFYDLLKRKTLSSNLEKLKNQVSQLISKYNSHKTFCLDPQGSFAVQIKSIPIIKTDDVKTILKSYIPTESLSQKSLSIIEKLQTLKFLTSVNTLNISVNDILEQENELTSLIQSELNLEPDISYNVMVKLQQKFISMATLHLSNEETAQILSFNNRYNSPDSLYVVPQNLSSEIQSVFLEDHLFDDEATWCTHFVMERIVYDCLEDNPDYLAKANELNTFANTLDFSNIDDIQKFKQKATIFAQLLDKNPSLKKLRQHTANPYAPPLNIYQYQHTWMNMFKDSFNWIYSGRKKIKKEISSFPALAPSLSIIASENFNKQDKLFKNKQSEIEKNAFIKFSNNSNRFKVFNSETEWILDGHVIQTPGNIFELSKSELNSKELLKKACPFLKQSPIAKTNNQLFNTTLLSEEEFISLTESSDLIENGLDKSFKYKQIQFFSSIDEYLKDPISLEATHHIIKVLEDTSNSVFDLTFFKSTIQGLLHDYGFPDTINSKHIIDLFTSFEKNIINSTDTLNLEILINRFFPKGKIPLLQMLNESKHLTHHLLNTKNEHPELFKLFNELAESQDNLSSIADSTNTNFYYLFFKILQVIYNEQKKQIKPFKERILEKFRLENESDDAILQRMYKLKDERIKDFQNETKQDLKKKQQQIHDILSEISDTTELKLNELIAAFEYANNPKHKIDIVMKNKLNEAIAELSLYLSRVTKKRLELYKKIYEI